MNIIWCTFIHISAYFLKSCLFDVSVSITGVNVTLMAFLVKGQIVEWIRSAENYKLNPTTVSWCLLHFGFSYVSLYSSLPFHKFVSCNCFHSFLTVILSFLTRSLHVVLGLHNNHLFSILFYTLKGILSSSMCNTLHITSCQTIFPHMECYSRGLRDSTVTAW